MEVVGNLRQRARGDEDDELIDEADKEQRAEQPGRRPDGGREDRATS
ncbi:MAG TPA: hypothetical protein VGR61_08965 [Candidatus Dormibacteraeota bacterium]|nr:hypothetical protein [Candidatus Dormibacteraeota bacterium]